MPLVLSAPAHPPWVRWQRRYHMRAFPGIRRSPFETNDRPLLSPTRTNRGALDDHRARPLLDRMRCSVLNCTNRPIGPPVSSPTANIFPKKCSESETRATRRAYQVCSTARTSANKYRRAACCEARFRANCGPLIQGAATPANRLRPSKRRGPWRTHPRNACSPGARASGKQMRS